MLRRTLIPLVVVVLAFTSLSCSKEPKPDHRGVFVVAGKVITEIRPIAIDTEFTPEGFAMPFFTSAPAVKVPPADFYFILYGDYKPFDLKPFTFRNNRYEEDTVQGSLANLLESGGMPGEKEMYKCRLTKALAPGTYVFEVEHGDTTLHFPFVKAE